MIMGAYSFITYACRDAQNKPAWQDKTYATHTPLAFAAMCKYYYSY